ncbi:hypothetical protein PMAYCL1PPCAC_10034, partial [Pristionchus mayeri]
LLPLLFQKKISSLAPLLLDEKCLGGFEKRSGLSSLTPRQLSTLEVTDDDFNGIDGVVDTWDGFDKNDDDFSNLLSSIRFGKSKKHGKPILIYSVDMMAILRKKFLMQRGSALPHLTEELEDACPPKAYGFPFVRILYATLEFAHLETTDGKFSKEPLLHNFHLYSF